MKRKKRILVSLLMLTLMMAVLPLNVIAAKNKIIPNNNRGIPDKVLYQTILHKLNKNNNDVFTEKEAAKIKYLNASNYDKVLKIKSLKGIGKLKNLTELDVSFNNLKSLSGVEKLYNLTIIQAYNNKIRDITALQNLTKLQHIIIDGNKITNLKSIEKLTNLVSIHAQINKIKKLPDMNKYPELKQVNFKYNLISKKEFNQKLPSIWDRNDVWFESQVKLQNLVKTINLVKPTSFSAINKRTKTISGIANKNSTISIRDPKGKKIISVKTDNKGKFTFKNLNLKKWAGMTLSLQSYVVDQLYGEKNILKEVKFTVR